MENATKALTMAASVLIALVIIGAILLVFNNLSSYQKVNEQLKKDARVIEFNNQFETYNRTDVRGSDLLSLINRVIDYNERQSYVGTEGKDLGYKPILLTIYLGSNSGSIKIPIDDTNYNSLFKKTEYKIYYEEKDNKIYKRNNDLEDILIKIKNIEDNSNFTQSELTALCVSLNSIFLGDSPSEKSKESAVEKYNNIVKKQISNYSEIQSIKNDVFNYYEYIQFKRTYFNCSKDPEGKTSGVVYDENIGRITEMYFTGNGKIE